jgi:hypothetical protein
MEKTKGAAMTTKKPKTKKPVTLADVKYTDGWGRERNRYTVERKRLTSLLSNAVLGGRLLGLGPVQYSRICWVLYDRKERTIVPELVKMASCRGIGKSASQLVSK